MSATTKVPLGASTTNRKWYLDVNTGTTASPVWTGVFGMLDFKDKGDPTLKEDSDFDSEGYKSSTVTALEWGAECKVSRKVRPSDPTAYDPGQEKLRATSLLLGKSNSVEVRYYEMEPDGPRVEAWQGNAAVSWVPDGGPMDELSTVSVTLTGQGLRTAIAHPDGTPAIPAITGLSDSTGGTAGGELVLISGHGFIGTVATSGVKFGATNATNWEVVNDNQIVAQTPAHAAGAVPVVVTNAAGASTVANPTYTYA